MTNPVFGKSITRQFAADDGQSYLTIPVQSPTIYLFSEAPAFSAAQAGTGAIQKISTWTQEPQKFSAEYQFAAVEDPSPEGTVISRGYWEAINYLAETEGETQTRIRYFEISKPDIPDELPGTSIDDIKSVFPSINSFVTDTQILKFVGLAESQARIDLESRGAEYKWGRFKKLSKLKLCVAYKTIELIAVSEVVKGAEDKWVWLVDHFKESYIQTIKKLTLPYDVNGDTIADTNETIDNFATIAR